MARAFRQCVAESIALFCGMIRPSYALCAVKTPRAMSFSPGENYCAVARVPL